MPRIGILIRYWLPIAIWMVVIFSASSDQGSFQHSSQIIEPFLLWLLPHLQPATVHEVVVVVRKCAHLTEYAILAILIWRAFSRRVGMEARSWRWRHAGLTLLIVFLYAATDELHQLFVPTREGTIRDVLIDTTGAAIGLFVVWAILQFRVCKHIDVRNVRND